jgi:Skp family chaperone for outer membrane proteins
MMLYLIFLSKSAMKKMIKNVLSLGNNWINAMETNLDNMEANLDEADKIKHQSDIRNNRDHLNNLKGKNSSEWREYATQCMIEIMDNKTQ